MQMPTLRAVFSCLCYSLVISMAVMTNATATSVQQLSFDQLVTQAELVFEGKVVDSQTQWNTAGTQIFTTVRFQISDVIVGDYSDDELELEFLGGTVGIDTMQVQAMRYPELGEHGVYFVESTGDKFVNPLLGWSQGHFKVRQDDQLGAVMMSAEGAAINGIDADTSVTVGRLSHGLAAGVQVEQHSTASAVSLHSFKTMIVTRKAKAESASPDSALTPSQTPR